MAKIVFTQEQQLDLTRRLQLVLLEAISATGSWERDELRFQGGTCLSLTYGSPRFSEDLDFILGTDRGLNRMLTAARARVENTLRLALPGVVVKFDSRDADPEAVDAKNPRTFTMTVSHPDWYRAVKVKVEFWLTNPEAVKQYESGVRTAQVLTAAVAGNPLRMTIPPVLVPAAALEEVLVDKVHAVAGRQYLKARDIFDLWWLRQQGLKDWKAEVIRRYPYHSQMYADSPALPELAVKLSEKAKDIAALAGKPEFSADLKRWLGDDSSLATQQSADAIALEVSSSLAALAVELSAERAPTPRAKRSADSTAAGDPPITAPTLDGKGDQDTFISRWTKVINEAFPPGIPLHEAFSEPLADDEAPAAESKSKSPSASKRPRKPK